MLRFKRDDGTSYPEWKEKKLDDIGEIITGNTPSTQDSENYGNEFMFCSPADMGDNKYILKTGKMLSQKGFDISRKLPGGSVLVTCIGSTIGKIGIASKEMTSNQQINSIIAYDSINNEFIYYSLLKNFKKYLNLVSSQAVPILNKSQFEKLVISVPHIEEQQKIADFLSEVDNIITASEQEIESLEMQKKGAMQKIFSQEVRFKADDGSEYPAWGEKQISQLFSISAGGDIDKEKCTPEMTDNNIYPVYANATAKNGLYGYTDMFRIEGETITVTGRGDVGIAKARKEKYYPIVRLLVLKPKENLDILFFEAVINRAKFYEEYTGVPQLTAPQVGKIKVKFPCLEEQQKIADFLSELDNAIEYAKEELEVWKNIKKGLLQQMFE